MTLRDEQRFTLSADVVSRVIDGEAVLLDLVSSKYLGLNAVATRVWELLGEGKAFGAIRSALLAEFEVPADVLERDLDQLFADLQGRALIQEA
jgi:Coenzyme PQQ synthesis protein D (PqqD)